MPRVYNPSCDKENYGRNFWILPDGSKGECGYCGHSNWAKENGYKEHELESIAVRVTWRPSENQPKIMFFKLKRVTKKQATTLKRFCKQFGVDMPNLTFSSSEFIA